MLEEIRAGYIDYDHSISRFEKSYFSYLPTVHEVTNCFFSCEGFISECLNHLYSVKATDILNHLFSEIKRMLVVLSPCNAYIIYGINNYQNSHKQKLVGYNIPVATYSDELLWQFVNMFQPNGTECFAYIYHDSENLSQFKITRSSFNQITVSTRYQPLKPTPAENR